MDENHQDKTESKTPAAEDMPELPLLPRKNQEKLDRLQKDRKKAKQTLRVVGISAAFVGVIVLVVGIIGGYLFNWNWTGLGPYISPPHLKDSDFQRGKTLWDWLQLLIVPLVLAIGGFWLSQMQKTTEQRSTTDNQRAAALQAYIDKISELLLTEHLSELTENGELKPEYDQVRKIARVRTITILFQLDARRIGFVFAFLREAGLNSTIPNSSIVSLSDADLSKIDLSHANLIAANLSHVTLIQADLSFAILSSADLSFARLEGANFKYAILSGANLSYAYLFGANLSYAALVDADLSYADLRYADLRHAFLWQADLRYADLSYANLYHAKLTPEQLDQAKSLEGSTMPDGSIHP